MFQPSLMFERFGRPKDVPTVRRSDGRPRYGLDMDETDGERRRRRVRGHRPDRLTHGTSDPPATNAPSPGTPPDPTGTPGPKAEPIAAETPSAGTRNDAVPAPSRMARFGARRSAERPRPEPRPWSRGTDRSATGSAVSDRAGRPDRPDAPDRDSADRADREPFDSHAPGPADDHERGLRGLIGGGSSQVSVSAAMRARDASRPTDADIANAEQTLAIVHRGWVPRD